MLHSPMEINLNICTNGMHMSHSLESMKEKVILIKSRNSLLRHLQTYHVAVQWKGQEGTPPPDFIALLLLLVLNSQCYHSPEVSVRWYFVNLTFMFVMTFLRY